MDSWRARVQVPAAQSPALSFWLHRWSRWPGSRLGDGGSRPKLDTRPPPPHNPRMLRLGLIGTQFIGNLYCHSLRSVDGLEVTAVASPNTAQAFCERWDIARHYTDWRELVADDDIDA